MDRRCQGRDWRSFSSLSLLDTSPQQLAQDQCQGGSGLRPPTWSLSAPSSSSPPCTSTLPILHMVVTMVLDLGLVRAGIPLIATTPPTCSGQTAGYSTNTILQRHHLEKFQIQFVTLSISDTCWRATMPSPGWSSILSHTIGDPVFRSMCRPSYSSTMPWLP